MLLKEMCFYFYVWYCVLVVIYKYLIKILVIVVEFRFVVFKRKYLSDYDFYYLEKYVNDLDF